MGTRTYGLSGSGMDIDKMVSDLMKAQRVPYNRLFQKKTQTEWKKADLSKLYPSITAFRSALTNYKLQSTLMPKSVSTTDDKLVTATANADAANITHTLHVDRLASYASTTSSAALGSNPAAASLSSQFGASFSGTKTFTITNNDVKDTSGNPIVATVSINTDTETVYDLVSKINKLGIKVNASYDATVDKFYLTTTNTGSNATLNIGGADSAWMTGTFKVAGNATGQNANFVLDGITYDDSSNISSNTFTLSGVTYTLKNTMAAGVTSTLTVNNDVDKAVSTIKSLVDTYNKLITDINLKLNETYYRDFPPLTDEQKKDMKDSDITAYQEKARSGLLRRDPILTELTNTMRLDFSSIAAGAPGKYTSAASIGITTGKYVDDKGNINNEYKLAGYLYVDETKLRKALNDDPSALYTVFGTPGADHDHEGIAYKLSETLDNIVIKLKKQGATTSSVDDPNTTLGDAITSYKKDMANMELRLKMIQNRYYKQFDAMEAAVNRANQQSAWLAQSFGGNK